MVGSSVLLSVSWSVEIGAPAAGRVAGLLALESWRVAAGAAGWAGVIAVCVASWWDGW
jgi:hypothetical protein